MSIYFNFLTTRINIIVAIISYDYLRSMTRNIYLAVIECCTVLREIYGEDSFLFQCNKIFLDARTIANFSYQCTLI